MFQMIVRKFTVAIILLNLNKYFSKNHGFGYRSLAPQDGSKSKVSIYFCDSHLPLSGNFNYYLPVSRSRQLYNSESEGRNFFLEKLCELGLGEVSQLHDNYVIHLHTMHWLGWYIIMNSPIQSRCFNISLYNQHHHRAQAFYIRH